MLKQYKENYGKYPETTYAKGKKLWNISEVVLTFKVVKKMLQIASIRMKEAVESTLPGQNLRRGSASNSAETINPLNESEGPNFFVMAGKRLKEIGFRFSTERDSNLIHFTKSISNPSQTSGSGSEGLLRVAYRLESPSLLETAEKKEVLKQETFLQQVVSNQLQIIDEMKNRKTIPY